MAIRTQADPRSSSRGDNHVPPEDDPVCIVGMGKVYHLCLLTRI